MDRSITKEMKNMPLKSSCNFEVFPIAVIPDEWCPGGRIIYKGDGGHGIFSSSIEELKTCNPPHLVDGYVENLKGNFFEWINSQQRKYCPIGKEPREPRLGPDDLLPIDANKNDFNLGWIVFDPDARKLEDYLEIKAPAIRAPRKRTKKKALR
jgi:hypothetical protein